MKYALFCTVFGLFVTQFMVSEADAQVIQLPTVRVFNVQTTVGVPDGGTISLGGSTSSSSGRISRGIPGLSGPAFNNRAFGRSSAASRASATVKIINLREMEAAVLAEARRRRQNGAYFNPNGTAATRAKADFISKNIGRSRRR